ncbi:MAG: polyphosphate:AMP phosphotransferase [Gammaproteobacteria bacterium]|nr:polyphosphate:AMP phosphotransferase [Gammaproteobacteria bacterium]
MFETAELGRKVSRKDFAEQEPDLHTALLKAQFALQDARVPVIILISGVEGAGKGSVVNRLHKWLDTRGVETHALWDESEEERERPFFWRFWRVMPPRGGIAVLFGSWYTQPIVDHALKRTDVDAYERALHRNVQLEQLLVDDGALIVKFWFHLTRKQQQARLEADLEAGTASPQLKAYARSYKRFTKVSERAVRLTDRGVAPWHIIEAAEEYYRDLTAGRLLLEAMQNRLALLAMTPDPAEVASETQIVPTVGPTERTVLETVDLSARLDGKDYEQRLEDRQSELRKLAWKAKEQGRNTVMVFEGWDAAGKGGAIRRVTAGMDARLYRVISTAAPTDEELAHHYLWRFWRHIPRCGHMTIYDRSWYGRVLVERVERYASPDAWQRAYQEINDFEEQLVDHGVILLKFWLHISPEEQLARFKEREQVERKQHKITEEDWRNRERWDAYRAAVHDMVARCSTDYAPWTLIGANDKKTARIEVLDTVCEALGKALD